MKKIINWLLVVCFIGLAACDPQEDKNQGLPSLVTKENIKVTITPGTENPNLLHFQLATPECVANFNCPELGISKHGITEFTQKVIWPGTYTLLVQVYNAGGLTPDVVEVPFTVDTTDPTVCADETFKNLTGGCDASEGKTWRINNAVSGHIGCGPEAGTWNEWWNPGANSLDQALYDDNLTFFLNASQRVVLDNKGKSFMNESTASLFPDGNPGGSFVTSHYTPAINATWAVETVNGENWLVLTNAFPAYAVNAGAIKSGHYKIIELTETDMHIVFLPGGISWHYLLTSTPR